MQGVLGAFREIDSAVHAIEDLKKERIGDITVYTPAPRHEFEPWQWGGYAPTWVDYSILLGSFGWFFMWFLLFIKQLPVMAIMEIKEVVPPRFKHYHADPHDLTEGAVDASSIDLEGEHY